MDNKKSWLPKKEIFCYKDLPKYIIGLSSGWTWDKLFKRSFIETYQLRFPEIHNSEDGMFTFGALCVADKISVIDEILVTHRTNTSTQLSECRDKSPECFIEGAKILKEFLEKNDKYEAVKQSFINWFVEHSYWHLDTLNIKNEFELENKLYKVFTDLDVFEHNADYFYNYEHYILLKMMIHKVPYDLAKLVISNQFCTKKNQTKYSFKEKIFSIKNESNHKVVCIIGIKIKIKKYK